MLVIQGCLFIFWHQQRWTVPQVFRRIEMERLVLSFMSWQNSKYCTQKHNKLFFCTAPFSPSTCSWHSSLSVVSTAAKAQTKLHCTRWKPHTYSLEVLSSTHEDMTIPTSFMEPALSSKARTGSVLPSSFKTHLQSKVSLHSCPGSPSQVPSKQGLVAGYEHMIFFFLKIKYFCPCFCSPSLQKILGQGRTPGS